MYGVLSKSFSDGAIPGMPKAFNTPAVAAFGIVAIASLVLTSLVAGLAYYKASHNKEELENVHDYDIKQSKDPQVESHIQVRQNI